MRQYILFIDIFHFLYMFKTKTFICYNCCDLQ